MAAIITVSCEITTHDLGDSQSAREKARALEDRLAALAKEFGPNEKISGLVKMSTSIGVMKRLLSEEELVDN